MTILILISVIFIALLFTGRNFIYSAKRNLFKDLASWSGKDIKINYNGSRGVPESEGKDNYLKLISDESRTYLEEQSK